MPELTSLADSLRQGLGAPLAVVAGALLLLFGRRLYWFFAGIVGFVATFLLVGRLMPELNEGAALVVALIGGAAGAVLTVFAHRLLLGVIGALGGGLIALWQAQALGLEQGAAWLLAVVLGVVVGAWLISALFEFALALLSSLLGAQLLVDVFAIEPQWVLPAYLGLVGFGLLFQLMRSKRRRKRRRRKSSD